eukprot:5224322-Pyramimonas_sp.AAC.1
MERACNVFIKEEILERKSGLVLRLAERRVRPAIRIVHRAAQPLAQQGSSRSRILNIPSQSEPNIKAHTQKNVRVSWRVTRSREHSVSHLPNKQCHRVPATSFFDREHRLHTTDRIVILCPSYRHASSEHLLQGWGVVSPFL